MSLRSTAFRFTRVSALGAAALACVLVVISRVHGLLNAYYENSMSWAENYAAFLAGENSLTLLGVMSPLLILLAVSFLHAVWRQNLTVVTASGVLVTWVSKIDISVPPPVSSVIKQFCPMCEVICSDVVVPVWVLAVVAAILCNTAELLHEDTESHLGDDGSRDPTELSGTLLPVTTQQLGHFVSNISGYSLVCLFLGVGILSFQYLELFENIGTMTATMLVLCALVVYEFVATNAGFSLAALAALTWHAGFAALQYDTALSEFLLATATLLTISAVGFLYSDLYKYL